MPSPFYNLGARFGIRALLGTSNISDIDVGMQAMRDDVESKMTGYVSGTHAARLAATALDGLLWRETDTGLLYLGTGAAWLRLNQVPQLPQMTWGAFTTGTGVINVAGSGDWSLGSLGTGIATVTYPTRPFNPTVTATTQLTGAYNGYVELEVIGPSTAAVATLNAQAAPPTLTNAIVHFVVIG